MTGSAVRRCRVLSRTAGGLVLVCSVSGVLVELAGSAAMVWAAIPDDTCDRVEVAVLVDRLVVEHGVDRRVVAADVAVTLDGLARAGCVDVG